LFVAAGASRQRQTKNILEEIIMDRVIILGSSSAVPTIDHENTHILVEAGSRLVLVDCPGTPTVRIEQAGVDPKRLTDIILTHFHADHVSGFAGLLMSLWLVGRKDPMDIYGLPLVIEKAQALLDLHDFEKLPNFYPIRYHPVPAGEQLPVLEHADLNVYGSLVEHMIPTMGLRFEFQASGKVVTYSCDTAPSQVVCRMAQGADVLIHEATGSNIGHTTAEQAGEIATQAAVGALYLIHYPPQLITKEELLEQGRKTYAGPITVAKDFMQISLSR
jgi:ribonuclease Z